MLTGKVAIVTGGNTGIGASISRRFAKEEAQVVVAYFELESQATSLVEEITAAGGRALAQECNVRSKDSVDELIELTRTALGRVDILVNNAGMNIPVPLLDLTEDQWDTVVDTNLKGPFLCTQAAARVMLEGGSGAIVNITSESGMSSITSPITNAHYAASKFGLSGLTRLSANALAPTIRVNAVAPGWIDTLIHDNPAELGRAQQVLGQIPLRRFGDPEEVAAAVTFLASDEASYMTGQTLVVGGGRVFW